MIIKDKTALVVPFQGEQPHLTEALECLLSDRDYARRLAARGQQHLRRHFLAGSMVHRLGRVYRRVLQTR